MDDLSISWKDNNSMMQIRKITTIKKQIFPHTCFHFLLSLMRSWGRKRLHRFSRSSGLSLATNGRVLRLSSRPFFSFSLLIGEEQLHPLFFSFYLLTFIIIFFERIYSTLFFLFLNKFTHLYWHAAQEVSKFFLPTMFCANRSHPSITNK